MSYEKSWQFALNQTPVDQTTQTQQAKSFLFQWKQFLLSIGWQVVSSSNGTVFNTSDNWNSIADVVQAASGSAHSHITLRSPVGCVAGLNGTYTGDQSRLYITIDYYGTTVYTMGQLVLHNVPPTGGSTSTMPTSTNQAVASSWAFLPSTGLASGLFHFAGTSTGQFWMGYTRTGSGNIGTWCGFFQGVAPGQNVNSEDYPFNAMLFPVAYSASGAINLSSNISGVGKGFNADGTAVTSTGNMMWIGNTSGTPIGAGGAGAGDTWALKAMMSPIYIHNSTVAKGAYAGRVPDIFITGTAVQQGSLDNAAAPAWALLGLMYLPVNAPISW